MCKNDNELMQQDCFRLTSFRSYSRIRSDDAVAGDCKAKSLNSGIAEENWKSVSRQSLVNFGTENHKQKIEVNAGLAGEPPPKFVVARASPPAETTELVPAARLQVPWNCDAHLFSLSRHGCRVSRPIPALVATAAYCPNLYESSAAFTCGTTA